MTIPSEEPVASKVLSGEIAETRIGAECAFGRARIYDRKGGVEPAGSVEGSG